MAFNFLNKKILVTGAGRGLGRQLAIRLAQNGAEVFALSRSSAPLESLKTEHPSITTIKQDLSDWKGTRSVLQQLEVMDGLVNNAALIPDDLTPALDTSIDILTKYAAINLYGAITCTQVVAKKMIKEGRKGSIVNISSINSLGAYRGILCYSSSKAALDIATKQFALELGAHDIRVNSVNSTLFLTDSVTELIERSEVPILETITSRMPIKRIPDIDEIVGPIMYLLSDYSSMVSGTLHVVDGANLSSISS